MKQNFFLLLIIVNTTGIFIYFNYNIESLKLPRQVNSTECKDKLREKCYDLYKILRYPSADRLHNPPLRKPPSYLLNEFTLFGKMPIVKYSYFNEAYQENIDLPLITNTILNKWLNKINTGLLNFNI